MQIRSDRIRSDFGTKIFISDWIGLIKLIIKLGNLIRKKIRESNFRPVDLFSFSIIFGKHVDFDWPPYFNPNSSKLGEINQLTDHFI